MMEGYIKFYRKIWDNPVVTADPETFTVWAWLLTHATHKPIDVMFGGERVSLKAGELVTGRKRIAAETKVHESKVYRVLKKLKIEHQIEQRTDHQKTAISIVAWDTYQAGEQGPEQRVNNDRTTSEQRVNTYKNNKNDKNDKNVFIDAREEDKDDPIWNMAPKYRDNLRALRETVKRVNQERRVAQ